MSNSAVRFALKRYKNFRYVINRGRVQIRIPAGVRGGINCILQQLRFVPLHVELRVCDQDDVDNNFRLN